MNPYPHSRPSLARNLLRAATVVSALSFLFFYVLYASGIIQLHAAEGGYSPPPTAAPPKPPVAPLATNLTVADLNAPPGTALPPGTLIEIGPARDPMMIASSKSIVMSFPTKRASFPVGQFVVAANSQLVPIAISVSPDRANTNHTFWYLIPESKVVIPITATAVKADAPSTSATTTNTPPTPPPSAGSTVLSGSKSAPITVMPKEAPPAQGAPQSAPPPKP